MSPTRSLLFFVFVLTLANCSFAPLTTPTSGRSLGEGNFQINASILPTLGATVSYGITENWDAGAIVEQQFGTVLSAYGKYSFINNSEGFAMSAYGGAFTGSGFGSSSGFYLAPIVSHKKDWFEIYLSTRFSNVRWDVASITQSDFDDSNYTIKTTDASFTFNYLQTDLGFNFIFSEGFSWNLHAKHFTFFSDDIESSNDIAPGTALLFNF